MDEALRAKIANMLLKIFSEGSDLPLQLVEECLKEPHLLSVYEESSGVAMDVVILDALMKGRCTLYLLSDWNVSTNSLVDVFFSDMSYQCKILTLSKFKV